MAALTKCLCLLLLLLPVGLSGCRKLQELSSKFSRDVPSRLTGGWTVVSGEDGQQSGLLELHSNGTFVASGLPKDLLGDATSATGAEVATGSGSWTFQRDADPRSVVLVFRVLQGSVPTALPVRTELVLEENRNMPQLSVHAGDPDEDERIVLQLTDVGEGTAR